MREQRFSISLRIWRSLGSVTAWIGYLFLLMPTLVVVPVSLSGSSELTFPPRELSLSLYRMFFTDPSWSGTALQSAKIAFMATVVSAVLGVPAAYALVRGNIRGLRAIKLFLLSPMLVPVIVLGLGFYLFFNRIGIGGSNLSLVIAHAILVAPFVIVSVSTGIRQTDPALEKAAMVMGASRARIFFSVVLPQIKNAVIVGCLFAFLISFDEVVVSYFITGPETMTLPVKMYSALRWEISPVIAAISAMLTFLSLLVSGALIVLRPQHENRSQK